MHRKLLLCGLLLSLTVPRLASAAPKTFDGYCLVLLSSPQPGEKPPQQEVHIDLGRTIELHTQGNLTFEVSYRNDLGREGVFGLSIHDKPNKKYVGLTDIAIGSGTTFPEQMDLMVKGVGGISCF